MAGEPSSAAAMAAELPDWLKWGANAALFVFALVAGPLAMRAGRKGEKEGEAEAFDADKFLDASPIRRLIAAAEGIARANQAIADNALIQTIALKTLAAAATLQARAVDKGFDERPIERDVEVRLAEVRLFREAK